MSRYIGRVSDDQQWRRHCWSPIGATYRLMIGL